VITANQLHRLWANLVCSFLEHGALVRVQGRSDWRNHKTLLQKRIRGVQIH
jgi:hypothetical protein